MTWDLDVPDTSDHNHPAPPPYTPYATETESTVADGRQNNVSSAHSTPDVSTLTRSTPGSAPQSQHYHAHASQNAVPGPSRQQRTSSISKPKPPNPAEAAPQVLPSSYPAAHTPPRTEDLRDRGRNNGAWRQYLQGLNVSEQGVDVSRLSLEDRTNKPLPPDPPSLPPRSSRPVPPVPPRPDRVDPRSRKPPPPPVRTQTRPHVPAQGQQSTPVNWPVHQTYARPQVGFPGSSQPQAEAVHHTWHQHPHQLPPESAQPRRYRQHSSPAAQFQPVQYVHEVPTTVQRVYEVPIPTQQVREVHAVPVQQVQQVAPQRQVHTVRSVPQFAHPDSRQLVRPLDPRLYSHPNGQSTAAAPNGHAAAGPSTAGYATAPVAGRQNGAPVPTIPSRRSSHPQTTQSNGALHPTSPLSQNGQTTSPNAAQFPPPILRTARKPTEPVSFPPPPRHKAAHSGSSTPRTPRTPPSVIDLTQDTSPSSAGSPPKPRAQSDVGRPSRSAPQSNGSAVGSVVAGSVVSAPSSAPSRSTVTAPSATSTPRRKTPAASTPTGTGVTVTSPTPSPSKVRCAGFTRTGQRCKRHVKTAAPGVSLLDDPDSGRYCKDHAGLLLKPAGFYWRTAAGGSGTWVEFKTFIPRALGEQTQALLRTTMESALSNKEAPGFLYVYELRGMGGASTSFFKVGRSDNVPRRIGQWTNQCASHAPVLRDVFPLSDNGGSNLPGAMERDATRMTSASKRWERLVHLELADRAASERPLAYKSLEAPCADCGAVHREIFPLASSEGYEAVVEVISRWEGFIRAISAPVGTPIKSRAKA